MLITILWIYLILVWLSHGRSFYSMNLVLSFGLTAVEFLSFKGKCSITHLPLDQLSCLDGARRCRVQLRLTPGSSGSGYSCWWRTMMSSHMLKKRRNLLEIKITDFQQWQINMCEFIIKVAKCGIWGCIRKTDFTWNRRNPVTHTWF